MVIRSSGQEFWEAAMLVGVPKEIRVPRRPDAGAVGEYVAHGHEVLVETGAGAGIGADDDNAYRAAGATIAGRPPRCSRSRRHDRQGQGAAAVEWVQLREGQILYTYLHLAADPEQTRA
jgi:alanine dehydrogenase